jgi:hypothetical protein
VDLRSTVLQIDARAFWLEWPDLPLGSSISLYLTDTRTHVSGEKRHRLILPLTSLHVGCWYLLTQIEYEGFCKRPEYHCSILPVVSQVSLIIFYHREIMELRLLNIKGVSISQHTVIARARGKGNDGN